jgi:hypothetical protein
MPMANSYLSHSGVLGRTLGEERRGDGGEERRGEGRKFRKLDLARGSFYN